MSLLGMACVTLTLQSFVNVDLFERGAYSIHASLASQTSNVPATPTSLSRATPAALTRDLLGAPSSSSDDNSGILGPPVVADTTYFSSPFEIYFQEQVIVLDEVVTFQLPLMPAPLPSSSSPALALPSRGGSSSRQGVEDVVLTLELWYNPEFDTQRMRCASSTRFLLPCLEATRHAHVYHEVTFGEGHFGLLHTLIAASLTGLALRPPHAPIPKRKIRFPSVFPPLPKIQPPPKSLQADFAALAEETPEIVRLSLDRLAAAYTKLVRDFEELWETCGMAVAMTAHLIETDDHAGGHPRALEFHGLVARAATLIGPQAVSLYTARLASMAESPDASPLDGLGFILQASQELADAYHTYTSCLTLSNTVSLRRILRARFEAFRFSAWGDNIFRYRHPVPDHVLNPVRPPSSPGLTAGMHLFDSRRKKWHKDLASRLLKLKLSSVPLAPIVPLSDKRYANACNAVIFQELLSTNPTFPRAWDWRDRPSLPPSVSSSSSSRLSDPDDLHLSDDAPAGPSDGFADVMFVPRPDQSDNNDNDNDGNDDDAQRKGVDPETAELMRTLGLTPLTRQEEHVLIGEGPQKEQLRGVHLFVYVHGLAGNSYDLRLFRDELSILYPEAEHLLSCANEADTLCCIGEMGANLASEVAEFIRVEDLRVGAISFVGHSLGTIITRAALRDPALAPWMRKLHAFISLSGPHCGTMFGSSTLVGSAMWIMKKWKRSQCLAQLSLTDAETLEETFLYQLAQDESIGLFDILVLVSSPQDRYVPYSSSRMELAPEALYSAEKGSVYMAILDALFSSLESTTVIRLDVVFGLDSVSLDTMVGRAAHILFLDSAAFLSLLANLLKIYLIPRVPTHDSSRRRGSGSDSGGDGDGDGNGGGDDDNDNATNSVVSSLPSVHADIDTSDAAPDTPVLPRTLFTADDDDNDREDGNNPTPSASSSSSSSACSSS